MLEGTPRRKTKRVQRRAGHAAFLATPLIRLGLRPIHLLPQGEKGRVAAPLAFVIPGRSRRGAKAETPESMPERSGNERRGAKGARPAGAPCVDMGLRAEAPAPAIGIGEADHFGNRGKGGLRPHCGLSAQFCRDPKPAIPKVPGY